MRGRAKYVIALTAFWFAWGAHGALSAPQKDADKPAPRTPPSVSASREDAGPSGKVVETMNSGGYTYVCLEKSGKKTWVAVPQTKVAVGEQRSFAAGAEMKNFTSKTLNRTFESIIFSAGPAGAAEAGPGAPGSPGETGSKAQASAPDKDIKVEKASGPNAYTVGELYAKSSSLDKKTVVVKAKVVKVSAGIMGRNWVHIQDGTGDSKKGSHNLVVTSQDTPAVGDVVTVTGTLAKDRDFGAGYLYKVIVEGATFQK